MLRDYAVVMTIPDYQTLMLPVLTTAASGETSVPLAAEVIADQFALTPEQREELLPSGKQRLLHNRIHWAKFHLSKAGLVDSPKRGIFKATDAGLALLAKSPAKIDVNFLKTYPAFADFYNQSTGAISKGSSPPKDVETSLNVTPEEQIDAAQMLLTNALKGELLTRVLDQPPAFFEYLIVQLLVAMGYGGSHEDAARQLGKSGDGGIDGVIDEDRLGLDRIYVQAKRYAVASPVGRPEIQGFVGSLVGLGATKGVFVTTSTFSKLAQDYARGLQHRVILIDGYRLTELMIEFNVGVRLNRVIEVKKLDEDFFDD